MNIGLWQEKYKVSLEIKKSLRDWKEICPKTPGIRLKKLSLAKCGTICTSTEIITTDFHPLNIIGTISPIINKYSMFTYKKINVNE